MGLDIYFYKEKRKQDEAEELAYFRKVNFLVSFFESQCGPIENLHPVTIKKEHIEELLRRCTDVLENHELAQELLPTCPGFFFGDTNYDEYYFEDVNEVLIVCESLLNEFDTLDSDECITFEIWY